MDQKRWKKIKPILEDALAAGPVGRTAFLHKACGDDAGLFDEVLDLLDLENEDSDPLERSAHSYVFPSSGGSATGDHIDKYKIISELGTGGMGSVYLAERVDGAYTQMVALKLIKEGIDSAEVLARFFNERQILATLQHDNIAHLIDGGATDKGRPFLAMEYIEGVPITEYVAENDMALEARLSLFAAICSAVSFAHKNLVIHRDLKPSNILVNKDGVPKLLDFGIAKLLPKEPAEAVTRTQHFVFTPEYASPEQVRGEILTTATDIYSLGVILYELLAGQRPYRTDGSNISQIFHVVCESNPAAPSRALIRTGGEKAPAGDSRPGFASKLKGDLDNIVLKALRKEPERRYSSVDQLLEDIQCYLDGLPVSASSGTWKYRTAKFIRRNRIAAAGVLLIIITLLGGLAATMYQARIASVERTKAENRFNDVRQLANSFVFEINDEIEKSPIKARSLLVERAVQYLDRLASESEGDDSLTAELAAAYEKIGDVQAELFKPNLGNAGAALESQNKALQLRSGLLAKKPDDASRMIDVASSRIKAGDILTLTGDIHGAAESYRLAVEISERAAANDQDVNVRKQLSSAYLRLGQVILRSGSLSESLQNYQKAFEINRQLLLADPANTVYILRQGIAHQYIGYVRMLMGNTEGANSDFEESLRSANDLVALEPKNMRFQRNLSDSYLWVGIGYRESGRLADSLANIRRSTDMQRSFLTADPENFGERNAVADCWIEVALTETKSTSYKAAITAFETAISGYSSVAESDKNDLSALVQIQVSRRSMADTLLKMNNAGAALKNYQEALKVMKEMTLRDPNNLDWQYELAGCYLGIGKSLKALNDTIGATKSLNEAAPVLEALITISPENVRFRRSRDETAQGP